MDSIQVHYANGWFGKFDQEPAPEDEYFLGKIRLEAATGEDFSDVVSIPKPAGMMERTFQFVKWLDKENPQGKWRYLMNSTNGGMRWDRVIMAGSSHGSTTAARFAKHQKFERVVMFCGPQDQSESGRVCKQPPKRIDSLASVLCSMVAGVVITIAEAGHCRGWQSSAQLSMAIRCRPRSRIRGV